MAQGSERRKWPRLEVAFRIRLTPLGGENPEFSEENYCTKNISTGGLLVESVAPLPVAVGSLLDVAISMPLAKYGFASSRRLEARGKVCRVMEGGEGNSNAVALEFMAPPRFVSA